jgi:hypothetical protein
MSVDPILLTPSNSAEIRSRFLVSTLVLMFAGVMLAASFWLPYRKIAVVTPALPQGVQFVYYLNHLDGPLVSTLAGRGISGDSRLADLRELQRSLSVAIVTALCLLGIAAGLVRRRWVALLALPAIFLPVIIVADTTRWLVSLVNVLAASDGPLRDPPTFLLFNRLAVAGFTLESHPGPGLALAVASSVTVLVGLWLRRQAHRAAARRSRAAEEASGSGSLSQHAI